jgi:antitoxin MazE
MRTTIRKIGNSKGIVLPKKVIDQYHLEGEVELVAAQNHIEIHPVASKRADWEDRFKAAKSEQYEEKLLGDFTNDFDREEWTW